MKKPRYKLQQDRIQTLETELDNLKTKVSNTIKFCDGLMEDPSLSHVDRIVWTVASLTKRILS